MDKMDMNAIWTSMCMEVNRENTTCVSQFVEETIGDVCTIKVRNQILVCVDEIYSNIVKYSHAKKLEMKCGISKDMITLVFIDDGIPYNPLKKADPDFETPKEERPIGGLGIFVVKKRMDFTKYQHKEDKNYFTIGKKIETQKEVIL